MKIVLGGTHFSAIAEEVLTLYDWIDFIVVGEGETPFRQLLRALRGPFSAPNGVACRDGDRVVVGARSRVFADADDIPQPSWQLVDLQPYFDWNPDRVVDYEPGLRLCGGRVTNVAVAAAAP